MEYDRLRLLPAPEATEIRQELLRLLRLCGESLRTEDIPSILDSAMRHVLETSFRDVGAHEGTLWLADTADETLVAAFNNRDRGFVGFRQPLKSGLISMVFATEQPFCQNRVSERADHSASADKVVGKITYAMIAVPLYFAGAVRGVISCVQHQCSPEEESPSGFAAAHLQQVEMDVAVLSRLIDERLIRIVLGADR